MAEEGSRQDFLTRLHAMARDDALRQGMSEQEAEACATALVERLCAPTWRHAVIANHVKNYLRALKRRCAHEFRGRRRGESMEGLGPPPASRATRWRRFSPGHGRGCERFCWLGIREIGRIT